jgi:hypothetical protein
VACPQPTQGAPLKKKEEGKSVGRLFFWDCFLSLVFVLFWGGSSLVPFPLALFLPSLLLWVWVSVRRAWAWAWALCFVGARAVTKGRQNPPPRENDVHLRQLESVCHALKTFSILCIVVFFTLKYVSSPVCMVEKLSKTVERVFYSRTTLTWSFTRMVMVPSAAGFVSAVASAMFNCIRKGCV